ncbi:oxygenase MpaB family protein [Pseudarthrobacter sulfonivorans]|uniref:oxygenase MpaB family protein n=1 Tax=Pseudarthrobacter sulfonivorans TaxID=121292 RepID=UPI0021048949|nr:oxygenase MpaB family protein [Pseudarthrobacter sulfonivorans]
MLRLHPSLVHSLDRQLARGPDDWEQTFRQMALFDLAEDIQFGFFLAYYRNFAIPSGAATLVGNGEIPARPMKRSIDTGLVIYELIASGLDSERGRKMVELLNRVHRHVPGSQEDFLYVLMTLLVVPIRWTERHGWRKPTQTERDAATRFFRELGTRIHIADIPGTFEAAGRFFDDYERRRIAPSSAGRTLMGATVQVFQSMQPRVLHPVTTRMIATMLDDAPLAAALGLPRSTWWSRLALNAGLGVRNAIRRRTPLKTVASFVPGGAAPPIYPDGYDLAGIGPVNVMRRGDGTTS